MNNEQFKNLYESTENKTMIFDQLKKEVNWDESWERKKYSRYFNLLEMDASFLIAVDRTVNHRHYDVVNFVELFNEVLKRLLKKELSIKNGIKTEIRSSLPSIKYNHIKKDEVKNLSVFKNSSFIPSDDFGIYQQDFDLMINTIREFISDKYDSELAEDCINHYIYGASFENIAKHRGSSTSTRFRHIAYVWGTVRDCFLGGNGNGN